MPRVDSWDELDQLDTEHEVSGLYIMPWQTTPPDTLGLMSIRSEDLHGFAGFDFFLIDRFLQAGRPPSQVTIAEFELNVSQIGQTLTQSGYDREDLDSGAVLYSVLEDYQTDLHSPIAEDLRTIVSLKSAMYTIRWN